MLTPGKKGIAMTVLSLLLVSLNSIAQPQKVHFSRQDIEYFNGRILVDYRVNLDVSISTLKHTLEDFENFSKLSPLIVKSQIKHNGKDKVIEQVLRPCVLGICYSLKKHQKIHPGENGTTVATIIPQAGHFDSGFERWSVETFNDQTVLNYQADLTPGFFIPPIIGPILLRKFIHKELSDVAHKLSNLSG